jgi:hypothetical protein
MSELFFAPVSVSVYYDPADSAFCEALDRFLAPSKQYGRVLLWDGRSINPGDEWEKVYEQHLATDAVLILLLSSDFLASGTCLQQMRLALRRQQEGSAVVVPILVRPCSWEKTELHSLQILPGTQQAIDTETHPEVLWKEIATEIVRIADTIQTRAVVVSAPEDQDVVERLRQDIARESVALWWLNTSRVSSYADQQSYMREAIRQAHVVVLVVSPATSGSRLVQMQMDVVAYYHRSVLVFWAKGEDGDQPKPEQWQAEVVDARDERYEQACHWLVAHLRQREEEGVAKPQQPVLLSELRNPYKGLRPFTARDSDDFFGRERVVDDLITRLKHLLDSEQHGKQQARIFAIVGASGVGKSSIVRAGLLPRLQSGTIGGSREWIYLDPIMPGTYPLEALAVSLSQQPSLGDAVALRKYLTSDSLRVLHLLTSQLSGSSGRKVVLFVDQFEEVFTPIAKEEERQHFFDLLVTAASESRGSLLVLLALRADFFYAHLMHYPSLFHLLEDQHFTVLPMEREDLRRVIEGPAHLPDVQVHFEENLVGDLLFEMREQAGTLPLLEFTLDQLFAQRSDHQLTRQAYDKIGGVQGTVSRHAEATYADLPETHQMLTRTLFLRLIDPGMTEQDPTHRRAELSEFDLSDATQTRILRESIDKFIKARLLTADEYAGKTTLEVSHEVLIQAWPRLADWLREARDDICLQQTISKDVIEWERRDKPKDRLYRGSQLKEALAWQTRSMASSSEAIFLRASTARRTRTYISLFLVGVLMLGLLGTVGVLVPQQFLPLTVTTSKDNVVGSLRQTVESAKPGSTILLPATLKGPVVLTTTLIIGKDLTIRGPGAHLLTIESEDEAAREDGIVVLKGAHVLVSDLTFTVFGPMGLNLIENDGQFTLQRCLITGVTVKKVQVNTSQKRAPNNPVLSGAVLTNSGTLTVLNSTITGNLSEGDASVEGAIASVGGTVGLVDSQITADTINVNTGDIFGAAIEAGNTNLSLTNTLISRNTINDRGSGGSAGGSIAVDQGNATLTNSVISDNVMRGRSDAVGGGIFGNNSTIRLINSKVLNNTVTAPNEADGGGILTNDGSLQLVGSTIAGNVARGGTSASGGGIFSLRGKSGTGSMVLARTIVMHNTAQSVQGGAFGGGIVAGMMTMADSQVSDNAVVAASPGEGGPFGGGIVVAGTLTLTNGTVAGNTVTNSKGLASVGGIEVAGTSTTAAHIHLTNCTIAENSVAGSQGGSGGGLDLENTDGTIDFCTIYGNKAPTQAGGIDLTSEQEGQVVITIKNTLIAQNQAKTAPDVMGPFITGGYNLIQHAAGTVFLDPDQRHTTDRSGNQLTSLGIDPQLRMNGGFTPTLALLAPSPAINQIPPAACDVSIDQRGVKRPQHNACDIGAYEYQ